MKKLIFFVLYLLLIIEFSHIFLIKSYPIKYNSYVKEYSLMFNLDESLIYSIIKCESNFNKDIVSSAGACGLMQVMPSTSNYILGEDLSKNLFDAKFNIYVGSKYFKYLLDKFGSIDLAIISYNAGEGNVLNWLKDENYSKDGKTIFNIPFKETREYFYKVKNTYSIYSRLKNLNFYKVNYNI